MDSVTTAAMMQPVAQRQESFDDDDSWMASLVRLFKLNEQHCIAV